MYAYIYTLEEVHLGDWPVAWETAFAQKPEKVGNVSKWSLERLATCMFNKFFMSKNHAKVP